MMNCWWRIAEAAAAAEEEEETPMQLVFSGGTKEMLEVDAHTLFADDNLQKTNYKQWNSNNEL